MNVVRAWKSTRATKRFVDEVVDFEAMPEGAEGGLEDSGKHFPERSFSGRQSVLPKLVVDTARRDAEMSGGLALISLTLAKDGLDHRALAFFEGSSKVAIMPGEEDFGPGGSGSGSYLAKARRAFQFLPHFRWAVSQVQRGCVVLVGERPANDVLQLAHVAGEPGLLQGLDQTRGDAFDAGA